MNLNIPQLCLLRSVKTQGIPAELMGIYLNRCGATKEEWQALVTAGYVVLTDIEGRYYLTALGRKVYNRRPKTVYF